MKSHKIKNAQLINPLSISQALTLDETLVCVPPFSTFYIEKESKVAYNTLALEINNC